MRVNNPDAEKTGASLVAVKWEACINRGDDVVVLSCTVTTVDASATISGVGLILNTAKGTTVASCYTELSGGAESVTPALNLPPGGLAVGDIVMGVVTGEVQSQHFFIEENLTITECKDG